MAVEASSTGETDLVKTLKQIFEAHNSSRSVTLFGKKVSVSKPEDDSLQLSEKLPPTALVQLKGLFQQHLKRKAHRNDALPTLPLLNGIQDKDGSAVGFKRQRVGPDQVIMSGSQPAPSGGSHAGSLAEDMRAGPILQQVEDSVQRNDAAPLTVFYNGVVYVYDDIPSDQAQAIMILAESARSSISRSNSTEKLVPESVAPGQGTAPAKRKLTLADLPQARKASLQRFLEKRKDRLFVKADMRSFAGTSQISPPAMKKAPKLEA